MKFITLEKLKNINAEYNLLVGQRSNGKTTCCLDHLIDEKVEHGYAGAIIRRFDTDFTHGRAEAMFRSLVQRGVVFDKTGGMWTDICYKSRRWYLCKFDDELDKIVMDSTPLAYAFSIAGATDRPLDGTITLDLYANTAEPERVNKSAYLSPVKSLKGALRGDQSMLSPSITVYDEDVPRYNYARMPDFEGAPNTPRYYFIDTITSVGLHLWRLDMRCDVLMSWRTYIGALEALVERQEFERDPRLYDSEFVTAQAPIVTQIRASSSPFVALSDHTPHNNVVVTVTAPNR